MKAHSIKTDNANLAHKVQLRKMATAGLSELRVLDLFAGENKIWANFKYEKYYGIEKVKGKGNNLNADNMKVIASLDLSAFNVIDCDSYGVPFNQMSEIFRNRTLRPGTVIIYTCISNAMSAMNKQCLKTFGLQKMYKQCKTLFNQMSIPLFYAYLYNNGVRTVHMYTEKSASFTKEYGFFVKE